MDRFKFRAWVYDDELGKHKIVDVCKLHPCGDFCHVYVSEDDYEYEIESKYLMQYTGLKDKNGKLIYEGDILDWLSGYHGKKYEVITENSCSWIRCNTLDIPLFEIDTEEIEIIGNIYEHRGLLNEQGPKEG